MYYVNKDVDSLRRAEGPARKEGVLRLNLNENPEGLPEDFVRGVLSKVTPDFLSRYPDAGEFVNLYAKHANVSEECICAINGSEQGIRSIFMVFGKPGSSVVSVAPTFVMYMIYAQMIGLKFKTVSYDGSFKMDHRKILEQIGDDTSIVSIVNPHMPFGDCFTECQIREIIEKARKHDAIVVIDEAYHYFCGTTYIDMIREYDNVFVLRTFSKLFSIASCRLGVIMGCPEIMGHLAKCKSMSDVNGFALLFGSEALRRPELIKKMIDIEAEGHRYVVSELRDRGYTVHDAQGNFILFKTKHDAAEVGRRLKERDVYVKNHGDDLLRDWIRINTGSRNAMEKFLEALSEADN